MKNESVRKSLEKSKNVLEEKRKNGQSKKFTKKDQHVYNNCYELHSRAIKNQCICRHFAEWILDLHFHKLKATNTTTRCTQQDKKVLQTIYHA